MSAKSLLRYRTAVGGDNLLSAGAGAGAGQEGAWPAQPAQPQQNRGKKSPVAGSGSGEAAATRLEEDSFDEGIDDILAQVTFLMPETSRDTMHHACSALYLCPHPSSLLFTKQCDTSLPIFIFLLAWPRKRLVSHLAIVPVTSILVLARAVDTSHHHPVSVISIYKCWVRRLR